MLEDLEGVMKDRLEVFWCDAVQDIPDLVIGGQLLDPEQGLCVVEAAPLLHKPLEGQEGGALKEETAERGERQVRQREPLVGALTRVWPTLDGSSEQGYERGEDLGS